jgi:hypothetical protein
VPNHHSPDLEKGLEDLGQHFSAYAYFGVQPIPRNGHSTHIHKEEEVDDENYERYNLESERAIMVGEQMQDSGCDTSTHDDGVPCPGEVAAGNT